MSTAMATIEHASQLLDFTQELSINLLDSVVSFFHMAQGPQQRKADQILTQLKQHPDAWTRVETILEFSNNQQTKYFALQILESVIKTRWKVLPFEQCEGIKKYVVGLIIKISSEGDMLEEQKTYIRKLNKVLVEILKHEWPEKWPSFINDIVGSSKANESLCQNNMVILKLLSEEVFDFSCGQMTQAKANHLKNSLRSELCQLFTLFQFVLDNSQNVTLVDATLETLLCVLNWIPLGYIFETQLFRTLVCKFLNVPMFRNVTLKILTEIAGIDANQYDEQFEVLFSITMAQLKQMLPLTMNIKDVYANGKDDEQKFIQNLSLFLCTFLKEHGQLVEKKEKLHTTLLEALHYLFLISEVEETEIFKICLDYWNALASDLCLQNPFPSSTPRLIGSSQFQTIPPRRQVYLPVLSKVRLTMIARMAKPEEVQVFGNDRGEVVREFMKDTDAINLYKNMRETFVYLARLDNHDTERIVTEKLQNQVNGTEWSWKNLNTLCWAVGSISGAMHEEDEKRFLVPVIENLLDLFKIKCGKDKAMIASNIMYIVGQYPWLLRAHWGYLKTVVNKLFEFMHETHDGVQDMACDTFIKIAQNCGEHFIRVQVGEAMPFIEEIINSTQSIICDLQPQQVHTFYGAVGYMISAHTDSFVVERLIEKCMSLPNQAWDNIVKEATRNIDHLRGIQVVKQLGNILKTNVQGCKSIGHPFVTQLSRIYLDMLNVYRCLSENISVAIAENGEIVTKQPLIRAMRTVKTETLRLISTWVGKSNDAKLVCDNYIPPLLDAVLGDYQRNVPNAREPEVLSTMATFVNKLERNVTEHVPKIFDAVFECTLDMIKKNFEEFPEHRTNFFLLLQAVVQHCFQALLRVPQQFELVLHSIFWASKHTMGNVVDNGLHILHLLLISVEQEADALSFYQKYYMAIVRHMLSVVTDTSHAADLEMHAKILAHMFNLVQSGKVSEPLFAAEATQYPTNQAYVQESTANHLKQAFPLLQDAQIKLTVQGFFDPNQNVTAFSKHLQDFKVQSRNTEAKMSVTCIWKEDC